VSLLKAKLSIQTLEKLELEQLEPGLTHSYPAILGLEQCLPHFQSATAPDELVEVLNTTYLVATAKLFE
jgi:hypothetical protein